MALLIVLGAGLCLHHGRGGFMPLDQSIVWDGAWRIVSGQRPFVDFVVPNGLVPMALQAVVFRVLGVSWFGYVLHAAVVNGLFCAAAFALLRLGSAGPALAFFYALSSAVVFYPPFGVPFMDQHAFFFALLVVLAAAVAARGAGSGPGVAACSIPLLLLFGLLSKQLPTVLVPVAVAAAFWAWPPRDRPRLARGLGLGVVAIVVLLIAGGWAVDASLVRTYAIDLPGAIGRARIAELLGPGAYRAAAIEVRRAWGLTSVEVVALAFGFGLPLVARASASGAWRAAAGGLGAASYVLAGPSLGRAGIGLAMVAVALVPSRPLDTWGRALRPAVRLVVLGEVLVAVCFAHALLTFNQPHNAIPFAFIAIGLVHLGLLRAVGTGASGPAVAVTVTLLAVAGADAWIFERRVNVTRRVHKLDRKTMPVGATAAGLPTAMAFMRWQTPAEFAVRAADLGETARVLARAPRNFFLLGDSSILYALAGRPSVGPSVWFHEGLTYPRPGTKGFAEYERRLLESIERYDVGTVVIEGESTFLGTQLADFPRLQALLTRAECSRRQIGAFTLVTLCRGK